MKGRKVGRKGEREKGREEKERENEKLAMSIIETKKTEKEEE
jgi:hypothetical protein